MTYRLSHSSTESKHCPALLPRVHLSPPPGRIRAGGSDSSARSHPSSDRPGGAGELSAISPEPRPEIPAAECRRNSNRRERGNAGITDEGADSIGPRSGANWPGREQSGADPTAGNWGPRASGLSATARARFLAAGLLARARRRSAVAPFFLSIILAAERRLLSGAIACAVATWRSCMRAVEVNAAGRKRWTGFSGSRWWCGKYLGDNFWLLL